MSAEHVQRLACELAEPGSVRLGEQGFDRVLAAWRDWAASGGPMDEFVASLSEYPEAWAESHQVAPEDAAEFAASAEAARRIEAGEALRPGATVAEIAAFEARDRAKHEAWRADYVRRRARLDQGLRDLGSARPAQGGQAPGAPEGGELREIFEDHYASGGTLGSFAKLTAADLAAIGVQGRMPEARELAAWAAELDWKHGGDAGGTWAELSEAQREQVVDAYLVGVR